MSTESGDLQYQCNVIQFTVFKVHKDKEKQLRVFMANDKPVIQEISKKNHYVREIDISSAAKVFIPIVGDKLYRFKILLKRGNCYTSYYCTDLQVYHECVNYINNILGKYHYKNKFLDSVRSRSGKRGSIDDVRSRSESSNSSRYQTTASSRSRTSSLSSSQNDETDTYLEMKNLNDEDHTYMKMKDLNRTSSTIYENEYTLTDSDTQLQEKPLSRMSMLKYKVALECDYPIPIFDIKDEPLKDTVNSDGGIPSDLDPIIEKVLKMRDEIDYSGGVEVNISRDKMCDIEVIEFEKSLWISAIRNPNILDKNIHVGDRICTINSEIVSKKVEFTNYCRFENVLLRIQRLPKAKVFAITNESLKTSYNKDLVFNNADFNSRKNGKDTWVITELNSATNLDANIINTITASMTPFHAIVLHQSSFVKQIKGTRRPYIKP